MGAISDLFVTKTQKTKPSRIPAGHGGGFVFQERGRVSKSSTALFRNWAEHSEWVRAAISIRKGQISSAEWDIVPFDPNKGFSETVRQEVKSLFLEPSPALDSFRSWVEPIIEDQLVLDAGVVEKERTFGGKLVALHPVDGGTIKVSSTWDGSQPNTSRYWWCPTPTYEVPFKNSDMVYIMANPRTYTVMGLSPLETLKMTIDAELGASTYNTRQVQQSAPDGLFDLGEGARPEQVDAFKAYWESEVAGRGALGFLGGTKGANFIKFRDSNRDMQYDEWLKYLVRKICAVYLISPQDIGLTFDINKAEGAVQAEMSEDQGLRPLMSLNQDFFTREVVWDKSFGGRANNLAFRFTRLNIKDSIQKAEYMKLALAGMPWMSINGALMDAGYPPIDDPNDDSNPYNQLMANASQGIVRIDDVPSARESAMPPSPEPGEGKSQGGDSSKSSGSTGT
jgi:hypothetical protein